MLFAVQRELEAGGKLGQPGLGQAEAGGELVLVELQASGQLGQPEQLKASGELRQLGLAQLQAGGEGGKDLGAGGDLQEERKSKWSAGRVLGFDSNLALSRAGHPTLRWAPILSMPFLGGVRRVFSASAWAKWRRGGERAGAVPAAAARGA